MRAPATGDRGGLRRAGPAPARGLVDAVVVAYNSRDDLAACLAAVRRAGRLGSVVVVDHGTDGSGAHADALGALTLHEPANPGFGAGQNRGLGATTAPYVLLLNPDAVIDPAGLAQGIELLDRDASVGACQGVVADRRSGEPERSSGVSLRPVHLWGRLLHLRHLRRSTLARRLALRVPALADHVERTSPEPRPVESLAATALLARRSALDEVGGFDERFFLYGEDLDLCQRLRRAGWTLVALPVPWAVHASGSSAASSWQREVDWWRGTMQFAAKWYAPAPWALAVTAAAARTALLALRRPASARRAMAGCLRDPLAFRHALRRGATRGPGR